MTLQTIKSLDGKTEYVLLPVAVFSALQGAIEQELKKLEAQTGANNYVAFDPADYVDNPVALARLNAHVRQSELAQLLGVSQAYISKVENQERVSPRLLARVKQVLKQRGNKAS
jgi:DNA-binding XRE family transcriptional regulator